MTVLPPGTDGPAGHGGRASARLLARPGLAVAAGAPVALVALCYLPHYAPADLLACVLSLAAATVLVVAAGTSGFEDREERRLASRSPRAGPWPPGPTGPGRREMGRQAWSDPAGLSIDRWLVRWPGVAGAGAIFWWVSRLGAAGLLSALAFGAAGPGHAAPAAVAVVVLALFSVAPIGPGLVAVSLGTVATAGALVTASGTVALFRGQLTSSLLPPQRGLPTSASLATAAVHAATTVVLLCLLATCLLAATPAVSRGASRRAQWAIWAGVGAAVPCWGLAIPILVRSGGLSSLTVAVDGA
ncbi:MAG: hypothetical protein ABSE77_20495, partial [Acidimicrobiales bacterium]